MDYPMKNLRTTLTAIFLVSALGACSATTATTDVAAVQTKVNTTVANIAADAAALQPVLQNLCALGAVADGAFQQVAPALGASAADVADEGKASATLNDLCPLTAGTPTAATLAAAIPAVKAAVATITAKTTTP